MTDLIKTLPQYVIPQHGLSRLMGKLASLRRPAFLKNFAIKHFISHYGVNMAEALEPDFTRYENFNQFFTRKLALGMRVVDQKPNTIVSPSDGVVSEMGDINVNTLIQAKNHDYELIELLGGDAEQAKWFQNGSFMTIYLAPKDYHRVHMPFTGHFLKQVYVPGKLFSVNMRTARTVPNLFARNERVITLFQTSMGKMAVILVGAMIVGNIVITAKEDTVINKGEELGYFQLGSTAIVLFEANSVVLNSHKAHSVLKMGESIGLIKE